MGLLRPWRVLHTSKSILHWYELIPPLPPTPYICKFLPVFGPVEAYLDERTLARLAQLLVVIRYRAHALHVGGLAGPMQGAPRFSAAPIHTHRRANSGRQAWRPGNLAPEDYPF